MSRPAIRVSNLSKQFHIGIIQQRHDTFRDAVTRAFTSPLRRLRVNTQRPAPNDDTIWALKDVNFEVQPGEVVGIIGRNGAGKSTLLKVLSRITEPTTGEIAIRGRVASLLEVGTGFHPELSGRENVYLNGAILGMARREIVQKFDEIVAFAEVEKFIDTPVKRYSSGMYLRLAFAVAAYLDPEILVVDEVLAVGDATFQKKCLNKMDDVSRQGRTVLFVSHNMAAVTRLCSRTVMLNTGRMITDGPSHLVVREYLRSSAGTTAERTWPESESAPGNDITGLQAVRVVSPQGELQDALDIRQPIGLQMQFVVRQAGHVLAPNFHVFNDQGICLFAAIDQDPNWRRKPRVPGVYTTTAWIPGNLLSEGTVIVGAAVSTLNPVQIHFYERDAVAFQVVDSPDGNSARGDYAGGVPGVIRPLLDWKNEYIPTQP